MTCVTVMRRNNLKAWPLHEQGGRAYLLPLSGALTRVYRYDAHMAMYRSPVGRRLSSEAVEHFPIVLEAIAFDVDCFDTHGTTTPAPESWRRELRAKMHPLYEAHPQPYFYETRGGARIVYTQDEPTVIRTFDDVRAWTQEYVVAVAYLDRRFGIKADPSCADWQRLYRLPHATRDQGGEPENWLVVGNPDRIGSLKIQATHDDVDAARAMRPRTFGKRRDLDFVPCTADGYGLLYHALHARDGLIKQHGANAFVIRCPRESLHSCGETGNGSTLLYLPAAGEQVGAIHCFHQHCCGLSVRDWLREFSETELQAARVAAGIGRAA